MRASLAAFAQPVHDELGALGAEAAAAGGAEGSLCLDPHVQVLDGSAGSANEVVVSLWAGIPQGSGAAGGDAVRDAQLLEQLQRSVDRRQRGVWELRPHAGEHLLGGRVPPEVSEGAVYEDPLRGGPQAPFPEALLKFKISH
jgi:hypothetical protein